MVCDYCRLLLVAFLPPEADYSVNELCALYEQNRSSFVSMEIDCSCDKRTTEELAESIRAGIDTLEQLDPENLPSELIPFLEPDADSGVSLEEAARLFIEQNARSQRALLERATLANHYFFRVTPDLVDVHVYINDALDNPRKESAMERGLQSFTGGDFKHMQRQTGDKWLGLEPYPHMNRTGPVAWAKSVIAIDSVLPPFLESAVIESQYPTHVDSFWSQPAEIESFGSWPSDSGDELQLLIKPIDHISFLLFAIDPSVGAMPRWSSSWQCIHNHTVEQLNREIVSGLAAQAEFFRNASAITSSRREAVPLTIVEYDAYQEIENSGWYPFEITHKTLNLIESAETRSLSVDETPFGVGSISFLKVRSFQANAAVETGEPLNLADGTVFLDLDTNLSSVIGERPDAAIERLMEGQKRSRMRAWLIVNVVAVLIILTAILLRRRPGVVRRAD